MVKRIFALIMVSLVLVSVSAFAEDNIALNASVKANSIFQSYFASLAVDGNKDSQWSAIWWGSSSNPYYLMVDLGSVQNLSHIDLYGKDTLMGTRLSYINYNLYYSTESSAWDSNLTSAWGLMTSGSLKDTSSDYWDSINFDGAAARYLKFEVTGGTEFAHLYELEAYKAQGGVDIPSTPEPVSSVLFGIGAVIFGIRRKFAK
ncbi:MAG TPA: discoidin domain-containing protein [Candidatus Omnitrophota bacterium]|nr:discoidin domain-containing protein [Candidatus Omnitrophota bacterium]HPS19956.1 discoidin domain-containing protein [Candidatus Omnitrophota bacterium]